LLPSRFGWHWRFGFDSVVGMCVALGGVHRAGCLQHIASLSSQWGTSCRGLSLPEAVQLFFFFLLFFFSFVQSLLKYRRLLFIFRHLSARSANHTSRPGMHKSPTNQLVANARRWRRSRRAAVRGVSMHDGGCGVAALYIRYIWCRTLVRGSATGMRAPKTTPNSSHYSRWQPKKLKEVI